MLREAEVSSTSEILPLHSPEIQVADIEQCHRTHPGSQSLHLWLPCSQQYQASGEQAHQERRQ